MGRITAGNASGAADTAQAQRRWPGCACVHLLLHRAGERRSKEYMTVHFYDDAHEAFFREKLERAAASGRTPDNYFRSFLYLCGLCPDTRSHFHRLFDWRRRWLTAGRLVRAKESPGWHLTCGTAMGRSNRRMNGSLRHSCRMRYSAVGFSPASLRRCGSVSQNMRTLPHHSHVWDQAK